jgi:hypothetical protein
MKKLFAALSLAAVAMVGVVATPDTGSAIPAFARQTGNSCWGCHFQYFPKLNAYGRAFKLGGFTDAAVDLIEDANLSIPANLPVSFVSKVRYELTSTPDTTGDEIGTDRGEWQVPDEAVIYFGGRAGENAGYAIEWGGAWGNAKVVFPILKGDITAGVYVYTTDAIGAQAMEIFNVAGSRAIRAFEARKETYPNQGFGLDGPATALGLYVGGDLFFVNAALWGPLWGAEGGIDSAFDLMYYARVAVTPTFGDWSLMVGAHIYGGTATVASAVGSDTLVDVEADAMIVDAQVQGDLGNGMTLEIQAQYAKTGTEDKYPGRAEADGMMVGAIFGITPQIGVKAAYRVNNEGDLDGTSVGGGVYYNVYQNVTLSLEYFALDGDLEGHDSKMYVMLFSGF